MDKALKLIDIIKNNGGYITAKEIEKKISKVSLNNYDLENEHKKLNLFNKMKNLNIMFFEKYIEQ